MTSPSIQSYRQHLQERLNETCPKLCEHADEFGQQLESFCTECKRPGTNYLRALKSTMGDEDEDQWMDEKSMDTLVRVIEQMSPEISDIFKTGYATLCKNLCGNPNLVQKMCTNCESLVDNISDADLATLEQMEKHFIDQQNVL